MSKYGVISGSNTEKYGPEITPYLDTFHAVDNVADSRMIALTDEPLPCWKSKKEWKFKCKYWIKNSSTATSPKI